MTDLYEICKFRVTSEEDDDHHTLTFRHGDIPRVSSGSDIGTVLIRLKVDGTVDEITVDVGQTSAQRALALAQDALSWALAHLERLQGGLPRYAGRCVEYGDTGQCGGRDGHEGAHSFPTHEEMIAQRLSWPERQNRPGSVRNESAPLDVRAS